MADNTREYGFRWVRSETGGNEQPYPQRFRVASGYQPQVAATTNVDIHAGDPITLTSAGTVQLANGNETTQSAIWGIAIGFGPQYDGTAMWPRNKYIGGTAYGTILERQSYIWVVPVVGQIFEIDCVSNATATTEAGYYALIGENADMVLTADTTNANDPKATPQLDQTTHATTNTLQWRIIDIAPRVNQDFTGNYVKLRVTCNKVQQAPFNTTGI